MATATRPAVDAPFEIESADDFVLTHRLQSPAQSSRACCPPGRPLTDIGAVVVEIYRVFPKDSTFPPSGNVPTRVNSPSDVAFQERNSTSGLTFTPGVVSASFPVANSVQPGGIHLPSTPPGGDGSVTARKCSSR